MEVWAGVGGVKRVCIFYTAVSGTGGRQTDSRRTGSHVFLTSLLCYTNTEFFSFLKKMSHLV